MLRNEKNTQVKKYEKREQVLMETLYKTNRVTTNQAVQMLGISDATARRLFASLEMQGKVIRDYGGIQLSTQKNRYYFDYLKMVDIEEKKRIGKLAASLIEPGDTIYLDCGTTISYMAVALAERMRQESLLPLNIITNSLENMQILSEVPSCKVILTGGVYNPDRRDFSGPLTERYLSDFHFKKTFMGCDGISLDMGFSSNEMNISKLNICVLAHSDFSYVLATSTKFNRNSFVSYAALEQVHLLITDKLPNEEIAHKLKEKGLAVRVAD